MIVCIVQARTGSTRLPGKVLKEVCGKTMLELEIERISYSRLIDKTIVATTTNVSDDKIVGICKSINIECFRGSEDDVLDRYYKAAINLGLTNADSIIRLTGDCPLLDPNLIDEAIGLFLISKADYLANTIPPTYPDGFDIEIMSYSALERAWNEAEQLSEREHVTPYIYKHSDCFIHKYVRNNTNLSYLRLTLDEPEDYELIKFIYESLYTHNSLFTLNDILKLMDRNPEEFQKNCKYSRNEGYVKSLLNDGKVKP